MSVCGAVRCCFGGGGGSGTIRRGGVSEGGCGTSLACPPPSGCSCTRARSPSQGDARVGHRRSAGHFEPPRGAAAAAAAAAAAGRKAARRRRRRASRLRTALRSEAYQCRGGAPRDSATLIPPHPRDTDVSRGCAPVHPRDIDMLAGAHRAPREASSRARLRPHAFGSTPWAARPSAAHPSAARPSPARLLAARPSPARAIWARRRRVCCRRACSNTAARAGRI